MALTSFQVFAQVDTNKSKVSDKLAVEKVQKAKMRFIGVFDAGFKDVSIYKMVDSSDDVICYILMPENASSKTVDSKLIYEGNGVGSISCLRGK